MKQLISGTKGERRLLIVVEFRGCHVVPYLSQISTTTTSLWIM